MSAWHRLQGVHLAWPACAGEPGARDCKGIAMLHLIAFVYGLYALITAKFHLGKGRVATGQPARVAGIVLVAEGLVANAAVFALAAVGVRMGLLMQMAVTLPVLIAAFVVAFKIAGRGVATAQAQPVG